MGSCFNLQLFQNVVSRAGLESRRWEDDGHMPFFFYMPRLISKVRDKHEHPGWGRPVSRLIFAFDYQWHVLNYRPRKWGGMCLWDFRMCSVNQHYYIGKAQNGVFWRHEWDFIRVTRRYPDRNAKHLTENGAHITIQNLDSSVQSARRMSRGCQKFVHSQQHGYVYPKFKEPWEDPGTTSTTFRFLAGKCSTRSLWGWRKGKLHSKFTRMLIHEITTRTDIWTL